MTFDHVEHEVGILAHPRDIRAGIERLIQGHAEIVALAGNKVGSEP